MWTGGKPPLPVSKPASSFRNGPRDAELEALRQRGLAKLLNKHFTDTTAKLMAEKAAADAALADLEARKANTSDFQPSGDGALSPFDSLYLSVHQWRNECKRKERETLLMYQRYVHKFGAGKVNAPTSSSVCAASVSPPRPLLSSCSDDTPTSSPAVSARLSAPPPAHTPPSQVPAMKAVIESNLQDYLRTGAMAVPSVETMGMEKTFQTSHTKEEVEFRNFYRRQLEQKGVDARASPTMLSEKQDFAAGVGALDTINNANANTDDISNDKENQQHYIRTIGEEPWQANTEANKADETSVFKWQELDEDDDDLDSLISGLTSLNSAVTRVVMEEAEARVINFLKLEEEAIRKIMAEEDNTSIVSQNTYPSAVGEASLEATQQAEHLAKQMESILTEYKGATPEPPSTPSREPRKLETANAEEEWMVYYDETYQREYYHELKSDRTQWTSPAEEGAASPQSVLTHQEVTPEYGMSEGRSVSRILQYRRMRRRRRRRRIVALAVLSATSLVGGVVYLHGNPQAAEVASNWYVLQAASTAVHKVVDVELLESIMGRASTQMQQSIDWVTGQADLNIASADEARELAELNMESEAKARELAELNMENEAKARAQAEQQAVKSEEAKVKAEAALAEAQKKAARKEELDRKALAEVERRAAEEEHRRPPACNLPFAYAVNGKCYRLASINPVFDLQELVNAMMQ
jgi:hypothetical protein